MREEQEQFVLTLPLSSESGFPRYTPIRKIYKLLAVPSAFAVPPPLNTTLLFAIPEDIQAKESLWADFAGLIAGACGVPAAAVAWLDGARIHLTHTFGMPPVSWAYENRIQAAAALERMCVGRGGDEFKAGWGAATSRTFCNTDGTPAGAVCIFAKSAEIFPAQLLAQFARHAEYLLGCRGQTSKATEATRSHHAETMLREGELLFRSVFENSLLPIFFWNASDQIIDTNQAGVDLLGYTRDDYRKGRITWLSITPAGYEEMVAEMYLRVLKEGAVAPCEWEFITADGGRVLTQIVSALLPGRRDRGVVFVLDMTPRRIIEREMKRSQKALRQRERSLRLAIQAGNLGTWDFNPTTRNIKWSRRCRDIFGIGPRQLTTYREFLATVHTGDRKQLKRVIHQTLGLNGAGNCEVEFRILRKHDQEQRWVLARAQAFFGDISRKRPPYLLIGTLLDITDRKASEAELCRARDAAEAANTSKDQFIAKLSHELRTPLTPVLMGIDLLIQENAIEGPLRQDLLLMQRNVQLEARLIDDLLDVTRIVHGKLDLHLEDVNLHRLLEEAAEICMPQAQKRDITVCFRLEANEFWTGGDSARLEQVFWNLLQNATKFTQPGGIIQIATSNPAPGRISIAIRDSGIGIEPTAIPELFDAFEQGGNGVTRRYGGLGLGLSICKGVVELHGGSIRAFSEGIGTGSTFFVQLGTTSPPAILPPSPNFQTQPETPPELDREASRTEEPPVHLLVVEDHPHTGDVMARLLRRAGYAVALARSVCEAKNLATRQRFDLVVSDIGLPDGNGRELMAFLQEKYGLNGIALSGFGTDADLHASLEAGFREHVVKPVAWKQLDAALRRVLQDLNSVR